MKVKLLILLFLILILSGCTRPIVAKYKPGITLENNSISGEKIAIFQFDDQRYWIDSRDEKGNSVVGECGRWKFALKYDDVEFQPVSIVVQDVFIKEFKSIGVDAFKGEKTQNDSYSLKGKIFDFGFKNFQSTWSVESQRYVKLSLTLTNKDGVILFEDEPFEKTDKEDEGMGVTHSKNVDKLMMTALKEVVVSVVTRVNKELANRGVNSISVTLNGVDITPCLKNATEI